MKSIVVADASPLIGLARIGSLAVLRSLYGKVMVPVQVSEELQIGERRPGNLLLEEALHEGWLVVVKVREIAALTALKQVLDPGEAAAIILAEEQEARFLLIDERRGRHVARARGLRVVGTGGVLIAAKKRALIDRVGPLLDLLSANNYRLAEGLRRKILDLAGEE